MDAQERKYIEMTTKPVSRLVAGFAVPSIICILMTSFYNMADTFFVSRLNTQSVAAVGIIFAYMGIIQSISFFFGHGSGNYISRALGARETDNAATMASTGLITSLITSAVIGIVCLIFQETILRFFGATDTIMPYATKYFHYIVAGTPFISGSIVLNNQMRLQGNARLSMIGILSGGFLNLALDPLLIFTFNMGVAGAGLATAISQFLCFCLMLRICGLNGGIAINVRKFAPTLRNLTEIAAGGLPSLARQGLMFLSLICLNNGAAIYGDSAVAAFSVTSRVIAIAASILIGFGQGFQPVCGFNYGARKYLRVKEGVRFTFTYGTIYCTVFAIAAFILAPEIIQIFSNSDSELLRMGTIALRCHCVTFPLVATIIVSNMFFQNIRRTGPAVLVACARQGLFFVPAVLIGNALAGINGLYAAQPVSDICAFILCLPLLAAAYRQLSQDSGV